MQQRIVELSHINKSFPGVKALDDVSFDLNVGEVMALIGENGAGKSTLMKILSGVYQPDSGEIKVFGSTVEGLTPKKVQELGIAIIHQELNMCTHLTVAENIFLGREKTKGMVLSASEMNREARNILERLGMDIDPETVIGDLAVSKQQMVEIAKALSTNARILIMDEPTSALTSREISDLFAIIRKLRDSGCGIVYISHRLEELQHIADRVSIMRDGRRITTGDFSSFTMDSIIAGMVGRQIKEKFPKVQCEIGKTILKVEKLNAGRMVRDISFELHEGEIVGVAGLMGAGRTEMTRVIFGADARESGQLFLNGQPVEIHCPQDAIRAGIVLVPEDRKRDGLCTRLSIRDNVALPNLDILCSRLGAVHRRKERRMVRQTQKGLTIKMHDIEADAGSLSGGNQQKLVLGKWLARNSRVVMFDEPTRGIDVAAKVEIYHLMNELKKDGIGVLFVSSEMQEIMGVADRILVMCDGRMTGELFPESSTQNEILECATRFESKFQKVNSAYTSEGA
ncbi:MAG TPA: D-xylose ABC transporter ATP-binding protein [Clostridiales bacterium]|jgi:ribose transport system ATP-binding protein|nr:D-xylose ABC transporter ATP-binding protein [Clostridiales bacterium]